MKCKPKFITAYNIYYIINCIIVILLSVLDAGYSEEVIYVKNKTTNYKLIVKKLECNNSEYERFSNNLAKVYKATFGNRITNDSIYAWIPKHAYTYQLVSQCNTSNFPEILWVKVMGDLIVPYIPRYFNDKPEKILDVVYEVDSGMVLILYMRASEIYAEITKKVKSSTSQDVCQEKQLTELITIKDMDSMESNTYMMGKIGGTFSDDSITVTIETDKNSQIIFKYKNGLWSKDEIIAPLPAK
jgi:hypothetical protein